jgi:1-acyl-sn-glycerol-3-phosphate acyltransferase
MKSHTCYRIAQHVGRLVFSIYAPIACTGIENVPDSGAFLLASNHLSGLDPIVVGITCPRHLAFLGKKEIFENFFVSFIARAFQVIPVDRENPNITTVKRSIRSLRSGKPIMITPEGTRSHDGKLHEFKPGFIKLARRAKVPVLPVGIVGTFEVLPRHRKLPRPGRITVNYGPIHTAFLEGSDSHSDADIARHAEVVRSAVAALLNVLAG